MTIRLDAEVSSARRAEAPVAQCRPVSMAEAIALSGGEVYDRPEPPSAREPGPRPPSAVGDGEGMYAPTHPAAQPLGAPPVGFRGPSQRPPPLPEVGADVEALLRLVAEPSDALLIMVIDEGDGRKCRLSRRWTVGRALHELPAVISDATSAGNGVFYGVLPRPPWRPGEPSYAGPLAGRLVWVDLDYHEGLDALRGYPVPPTVIVSSGRYWHGLWATSARYPASFLVQASRGLGRALGGDAVGDPARVLRLPGSWWRKEGPGRMVRVIDLEPSRRYQLEEITRHTPDACASPVPTRTTLMLPDVLPDVPRELIDQIEAHPRMRHWWRGKVGDDRSSVDASLALALANRRIAPDVIASVLLARPDGGAAHRADQRDYLARTVTFACRTARSMDVRVRGGRSS